MLWIQIGLGAMIGANVLLVASLTFRLRIGRRLGAVPVASFLVLPPLATLGAGLTHLEQSKSTRFCLSCHVMEPYGTSLLIDNEEALPAQHYQNRRVPREEACYRCHSEYTLHGGLRAKLQGLSHLRVNYLGQIPETLKLYQPYPNSECLQCHQGARSFEEQEIHAGVRKKLQQEDISCLDCHDTAHDITGSKEHPLWEEGS